MPRPVYIICSESASQDSESRLISFFNVIERLTLETSPPKQGDADRDSRSVVLFQSISMRVTAAWMRTSDDEVGKEFQVQISIHLPSGKERLLIEDTVIAFPPDASFYRCGLQLRGNPFPSPGVHRFEGRLRQVGKDEWVRQDFPFEVVVAAEDSQNAPS